MDDLSPRALLLDFYGTVVEEDDVPIGQICEEIAQMSPLFVTAVEVRAYWGRLFGHMCAQSFGTTFRSQKELERMSLEHVLHHFEADLESETLSQILYTYWAHPTMFPESLEVLAQCRRPICLVSNIDNEELRSALNHNDLRFDWVVTSEDCRAYKPRGEMFEAALSLLGLTAGDVLHVGDSYAGDVRGAQSLGIPVLWINRKGKPVPCGDETPDSISADLTGLLKILCATEREEGKKL